MHKKIVLIILTLTISTLATAEVYKDFEPGSTLQDIKNRYPNAEFTDLKPAWIKPNESFLDMHGTGISGNIYLKLSTSDAVWNSVIEKETDTEQLALAHSMLEKPLDERLSLDWLRWIPTSVIPFNRLVSRYGKAEKCGFSEENFTPYCSWESKGILANLSDDKKNVHHVEYSFTKKDWDKKWGLDKKPKSSTKKNTKKTPG